PHRGLALAERAPRPDRSRARAAAQRRVAAQQRGLGRQDQLEARALADLGLELEAPAERRRELLRDRKAEAGPTAGLRDERPEQPLPQLRCDAGTVVLDGDVHGAV